MYYHGSPAQITTLDREICLTEDIEIAESYCEGIAGYVHEIDVPAALSIADEHDVWAAAEAIHGDVEAVYGYRPHTYELADEDEVRDQLAAGRFHGCEYRDLNPNNGREHDTLRIWAVEPLTITSVDALQAVP